MSRILLNFKTAYEDALKTLTDTYPAGEAKSMLKIIFEDVYKIYSPDNKRKINDHELERLNEIVNRLLNHEPLQYILGQADFYGLKFKVDQNVLIPRQETEELVYWVLETIDDFEMKEGVILDIGTGSGCIPITIKKNKPDFELSGIDISKSALAVAIENASINNTSVNFQYNSILDQKSWDCLSNYDVIISNPPYIPVSEKPLMPKNVLSFEPELALFVEDKEALIFYKTIAEFAIKKLKPMGYLFFELNEFNAHNVVKLLEEKNYRNIILKEDLNGKHRMIRAQKPK